MQIYECILETLEAHNLICAKSDHVEWYVLHGVLACTGSRYEADHLGSLQQREKPKACIVGRSSWVEECPGPAELVAWRHFQLMSKK